MSEPPSPTLSDSALLDSLEDDPRFDMATHREQRMQQLKAEAFRIKDLRESDFGKVMTFGEEKKLIERISKEKYCLIHFFHPDFQRCRIMDKRLEELAPKYPHTLFVRASVVDVPFLVTKFDIKVLPCVLVFVDSRCADRLIGFEELGDSDQFTAKALEFRLKQSGALISGDIRLADTVSRSLLDPNRKPTSGSDSEDDDDRTRRRKDAPRKGKMGIRNGLSTGMDTDEE